MKMNEDAELSQKVPPRGTVLSCFAVGVSFALIDAHAAVVASVGSVGCSRACSGGVP